MNLPQLPPAPPSSTKPAEVLAATLALTRAVLWWERTNEPWPLAAPSPCDGEDDALVCVLLALVVALGDQLEALDLSSVQVGATPVVFVWWGWRVERTSIELVASITRQPSTPWLAPLALARRVWGVMTAARHFAHLEHQGARDGVCVTDADLFDLEAWGRTTAPKLVAEQAEGAPRGVHALRVGCDLAQLNVC